MNTNTTQHHSTESTLPADCPSFCTPPQTSQITTWTIFSVIVAFFLLALACIVEKGDVRAVFKTVAVEISIEAKGKSEPVQSKRRDDQKSITAGAKE